MFVLLRNLISSSIMFVNKWLRSTEIGPRSRRIKRNAVYFVTRRESPFRGSIHSCSFFRPTHLDLLWQPVWSTTHRQCSHELQLFTVSRNEVVEKSANWSISTRYPQYRNLARKTDVLSILINTFCSILVHSFCRYLLILYFLYLHFSHGYDKFQKY